MLTDREPMSDIITFQAPVEEQGALSSHRPGRPSTRMKLSRTKEYQFGWLGVIPMLDVVFLLIFFLLLSSNFILQPGISVSMPLSRFTLGPQINPQIISITGGAAPAIYFRDQKSRPRTTRTVARRGEKRWPADHHQGRSPDSLRACGRSDESGAGTRNYFRGAGHRSRQVSTPLASENDLGLVFAWEHRPAPAIGDRGISSCASAVLHALCFYVFQIIYPPAVALLPPPGRVTVIAPNTEEGRVLLRWLEAEDPALASTTQPPVDGKSLTMPTIQHAPSYLTRQPALKSFQPLRPILRMPSAQPPAPVRAAAQTSRNRAEHRAHACALVSGTRSARRPPASRNEIQRLRA